MARVVAPDFDALLVLSFGGPEKLEDVMPFLENVTRGRGVPRERLLEVAEHYDARDGKSPINDLNRQLVADIEKDFADHALSLPVYWGNRNWDPFVGDVLAQMAADGITNAAVLVTSAYRSYSSCRQYREDLFGATVDSPVRVTRLPHYWDNPGFVEPFVRGVRDALAASPDAHVVFVTHSIPDSMNEASGGPGVGAYAAQHGAVAQRIADAAGIGSHSLAYCSRSGPPQVPWLEPDINDRLKELPAEGHRAVIVVPIGFVSDHMEVVHDLDVEARETAEELGLAFQRVATPGTAPEFVAMVRELVLAGTPAFCPVECCINPRSDREVVA